MRDIITEIWQTARRNKLRTTLTGFAVAWGIFMLIVLLGAGNGLINANMKQTESVLSNSMVVFGGRTSKAYQGLQEGRRISLQTRDLNTTENDFKDVIDEVGARYEIASTISYGEEYISTSITGIYPNHTKIDKMELLYGRFINAIDMKEKRKVLVLSNRQAKELAPGDYAALVGKYVHVNEFAFKVVGIYKDREEGQSEAFSSYATIKGIFGANTDETGNIEYTFHGLSTQQENDAFEKDYRRRLNANHRAHPDDERAVWLWNRYTQSMQMETGIGIIKTALWIVGLFTLLSGIVGVSNIMLITVKERIHESGIRKALGAKPMSIMKLIVVESVVITAFFGYIGMVIGMVADFALDKTIGSHPMDIGIMQMYIFKNIGVGFDVAIEATLLLIVAGTIAGIIPAWKGARVRPIEALRAEK